MARLINDKEIISLDSTVDKLTSINNVLSQQNIQLNEQILQSQKSIHQLRITNMYKAHENDFTIDDNIFENDEIS
jgi:hypothetical protein